MIRLKARWLSRPRKPVSTNRHSTRSSHAFPKSLSRAETKRMTTLHQTPGGVVAYAKGAPEVIVQSCASQLTETGIEPLDEARRTEMLERARQMAGEALRVLAVAYKPQRDVERC